MREGPPIGEGVSSLPGLRAEYMLFPIGIKGRVRFIASIMAKMQRGATGEGPIAPQASEMPPAARAASLLRDNGGPGGRYRMRQLPRQSEKKNG
jgi:hypothetical protein